MDITEIKNNDTYYRGFEEEDEIRFTILNNSEIELSIWEGYFSTIFNDMTTIIGGKGFTRDYCELIGAFKLGYPKVYLEPKEYLEDILQYRNKTFDFPEVKEVVNLIIKFLEYAIEIDSLFTMEVI